MYYYDSYAIIEIARGNPNYRAFLTSEGVTSSLNLLETFYILSQANQEALARRVFESVRDNAIDIPVWMIPDAALLRLRFLGATGRRFSYIDAMGYTYARQSGLQFLTGAEEFQGLEGVRFVR